MNRAEYGKQEKASLQEKLGKIASCESWLSSIPSYWGYGYKGTKKGSVRKWGKDRRTSHIRRMNPKNIKHM